MAELPLLPLPAPNLDTPPKGSGGGSKIKFPSRNRQTEKFGPAFERLRAVLARAQGTVLIQKTEHGIGLHGIAKVGHAIGASFVSVFQK